MAEKRKTTIRGTVKPKAAEQPGMNGLKPFYRRHPVLFIVLFVLSFAVLADYIAGLIWIPPNNEQVRTYHHYYHHSFYPYVSKRVGWGGHIYMLYTNSLGFKDAEPRKIEPESGERRLLIIGDSFTEGLGVAWEQTFPGIMANQLSAQGTEVLNAGVTTYLPYLYYLKVKYLIEEDGLKFDELLVMIDISDVQDEVEYARYREWEPKEYSFVRKFFFDLDKTLRSYSFILYKLHRLKWEQENRAMSDNKPRPWSTQLPQSDIDRQLWTLDQASFESWGKEGLLLARDHMQKLVELCYSHGIKISLAVYPWKLDIQNRNLNSIHVTFWEKFCQKRGLRFINLYPAFINEQLEVEQLFKTCYLNDGTHWNHNGHLRVANALLPYYLNTRNER